MKELTASDIEIVSGAGDVDWVQVGRDVATNGAIVVGGAFGLGVAGPIGAGVLGTAAGAAVGALYDAAGNPKDDGPMVCDMNLVGIDGMIGPDEREWCGL